MDILLLSLFFFPGILLRRATGETISEWLTTRILLSIGFHGLLFGIARDFGYYGSTSLVFYLCGITTIVLFLLWKGRKRFRELSGEVNWRETRGQIAFVLVFTGVSLYWSLFFPALLFDSTMYHLPIAKISASPEMFEFYASAENRIAWMVQGATGANLLEVFLSVFFKVDSELYRIVPPLISGLMLIGVFALARSIGLGVRGQNIAGVLFCCAPAVFALNGEYYVDLLLTVYVMFMFVSLHRVMIRTTGPLNLGDVLLMGALLGFAALTKKTGILAFVIPILGLLRRKADRKERTFHLAVLAVAFLIFLRYFLQMPSLAAYPDLGYSYSLMEFSREFWNVGIRYLILISPELNGAILFLFLCLVAIRFFEERSVRETPYSRILLFFVPIWFLAVVAGIYHVQRPDSFDRWGRYLFPMYSVVCVLVTYYGRTWIGMARSWSTLAPIRRACLLLLAVAVVGSYKAFPAAYLVEKAVHKYGSLSLQPLADEEQKREHAFGEANRVWSFVNGLADHHPDAKVLTEDLRVFYLNPISIGAFGVPADSDSVEEVYHWLKGQGIRWVLKAGWKTKSGRTDFEYADDLRNTAIQPFLSSGHVDLIAEFGSYRVYQVN